MLKVLIVVSIALLSTTAMASKHEKYVDMLINDGDDVYTKQYPILSIGSTTGIGTFGSTIDGTDLVLNFYQILQELMRQFH